MTFDEVEAELLRLEQRSKGLIALDIVGYTIIMLIDIKGLTQNLGQRQSGMLTQTTVVSIYEILTFLADCIIYDVDPALYDDIPESVNRLATQPSEIMTCSGHNNECWVERG